MQFKVVHYHFSLSYLRLSFLNNLFSPRRLQPLFGKFVSFLLGSLWKCKDFLSKFDHCRWHPCSANRQHALSAHHLKYLSKRKGLRQLCHDISKKCHTSNMMQDLVKPICIATTKAVWIVMFQLFHYCIGRKLNLILKLRDAEQINLTVLLQLFASFVSYISA